MMTAGAGEVLPSPSALMPSGLRRDSLDDLGYPHFGAAENPEERRYILG